MSSITGSTSPLLTQLCAARPRSSTILRADATAERQPECDEPAVVTMSAPWRGSAGPRCAHAVFPSVMFQQREQARWCAQISYAQNRAGTPPPASQICSKQVSQGRRRGTKSCTGARRKVRARTTRAVALLSSTRGACAALMGIVSDLLPVSHDDWGEVAAVPEESVPRLVGWCVRTMDSLKRKYRQLISCPSSTSSYS